MNDRPRVLVKEKIGDSGLQLLSEAGFDVEVGVDWPDDELTVLFAADPGIAGKRFELAAQAVELMAARLEQVLGRLEVRGPLMIYFVIFYILGFLLYASIFAGVGAAFNSVDEAQQWNFVILLPLIAFARCALPALRKRSEARALEAGVLTQGLTHVIASIAMMFVMHGAYKYANGWLSNREPAYLYDAGAHLVAVWREEVGRHKVGIASIHILDPDLDRE